MLIITPLIYFYGPDSNVNDEWLEKADRRKNNEQV
jgi:hypothetical protein